MQKENVGKNIPVDTKVVEGTGVGKDVRKENKADKKKKGAAPPPPSSAPPPEAKAVARKKKKAKKGMDGRPTETLGEEKPKKKAKIGPPPGKPPGHQEGGTGGGVGGIVPQLNLGGLSGIGAGAEAATPIGGMVGIEEATPMSAPLPPPPPPSASSSLGERRRSSVGIRLSLASIPETPVPTSEEPAAEADGVKKSVWTFYRDSDNQPYYLHETTGESRWAYEKDTEWMEVEDPSTGCTYLEHSKSGDTRWKKAENGTVWEEMKDPITQKHYYYSNAAGDSQWIAPLWLDYIDDETGCLYYFNTKTEESAWTKPEGFTDTVEGSTGVGGGGGGGAAAAIRLSLASNNETTPLAGQGTTPIAQTPRNLPVATPRIVNQPPRPTMGGGVVAGGKRSGGGGTVSAGVQYSMAKRPKTAPPQEQRGGQGGEVTESIVQEAKEGAVVDPNQASG